MKRFARWRHWRGVLAALLTTALAPSSLTLHAADLPLAREALLKSYRGEIQRLAVWCDKQGLSEQAKATRRWIPPSNSRVRFVYRLPVKAGSLGPPAAAPEGVADWHQRFAKLRIAQAEKLFQLAQQSVANGSVMLALQLANEAAHENPDHAKARKIFGDRKYDGSWRSAYAVRLMRRGWVWHDRFGWLPKSRVPRYERGERYLLGRWVNPATDARLHRDIDKGWKIETEHFSIRTNHSLEAGVRLARRLEQLHDVWRQLFAGYRLTKLQLSSMFNKGARPANRRKHLVKRRKHLVKYFRDRNEYRQALQDEIPNNVVTTGVYLSSKKTAFFYHDDEGDDNTLYHEVTHQLFSESPRVVNHVGQRSDFWIIEGIACYMESLVEHEDYFTLGGVDADRVQDARFYLFKDDEYLPLAKLTRLGMRGLQRHPNIARLYAQSAAITDFLMHSEGGRYRDALVSYLARIYQGRVVSLASVCGTPLETLDRQYRQFQRLGDDDLALLPRGPRLTYLLLGGTRVGDAGLARLKGLKNIDMIDLYKTPVTDKGLIHLVNLPKLQKLELGGTQITDAGLKHLARISNLRNLMLGATRISDDGLRFLTGLRNLTQLALWNTNLTDAGLVHLKGLRNLQDLDLSGSHISDAGLNHLRQLTRLRVLDVSDTKVTAAGVRSLQQALPNLKIQR